MRSLRPHLPPPILSVALSAYFMLVYGGANALAARRHDLPTWSYAWEQRLPFVPILIVPYMSIDLLFFLAPFLCRDRDERRTLTKRIAFGITVAGLFFVLMPFRYAGERPTTDGWLAPLFASLHSFDQPYNLVPSLHITLRTILADVYARRLPGAWRWVSLVWFSLIGFSTVLVYQHHLVDIVGGFMLAAVCFYLFPYRHEPHEVTPNRPLAMRYGVAAALCAALAFVRPWWSLWLLWPALSLAVAATSYAWFGPAIFRKRHGVLPLSTRIVLGPFLLGQSLSLRHYARRSNPHDRLHDTLVIGRLLKPHEARALIDAGVVAVVDLTGEFAASLPFRRLPYCNVQVSDLTAPTAAQLDRAIAFIREHRERGAVYVHCKAGYSRTAAVAGAALLDGDGTLSADEAIARLKQARRGMIVRPEIVACLRDYAARRDAGAAGSRPAEVRISSPQPA